MPDQHLSHPSFTSRVVPVIVLSDAKQAVPLAHALLEGGIDVMEITLRSDVALDAIEAVAKAVPQMHLGAGTVTRASDVPRVIDAGARFALSPGCTDALVDAIKTELDTRKRDAMLREALVLTRDNFYYVPLHHQLRPWAMKKNVTAVHNAVDRHESRYTRVD